MARAMTRDVARGRPAAFYLLGALLLFQGTGALFGGGSLVLDPSGASLGLDTARLANTPFADYRIPGLILLIVLGFLPLVSLAAGFLPSGSPSGIEARLGRRAWWIGSLAVGVGLIIWIAVQGWMLGFGHWLQLLYLGVGLAITAVTVWPSVVRYGEVHEG